VRIDEDGVDDSLLERMNEIEVFEEAFLVAEDLSRPPAGDLEKDLVEEEELPILLENEDPLGHFLYEVEKYSGKQSTFAFHGTYY
jgi:hypothetical protein